MFPNGRRAYQQTINMVCVWGGGGGGGGGGVSIDLHTHSANKFIYQLLCMIIEVYKQLTKCMSNILGSGPQAFDDA